MTEKVRAERNRTLTVSASEIPTLEKFILSANDIKKSFVDDSIINADLFDCLDYIPNGYFNLIIIDPPYNLDKDFHGKKFSSMKSDAYEDYLRSWFYKVCDKLAPNGTLYVCGDWKCTSSMQRVIEERLTVINRITWQREKGRGAKFNWKNAMEDIWFAVRNPKDYYFDVDAVMMKRKVIALTKWMEIQKIGRKQRMVISELHILLIFGMILAYLFGQCQRIPTIQLKSLKSCMPS